eukprot:5576907-Prymnesium_polylepis.2
MHQRHVIHRLVVTSLCEVVMVTHQTTSRSRRSDAQTYPDVPRHTEACPDVPRRAQTCRGVPRRAQTCPDVVRTWYKPKTL